MSMRQTFLLLFPEECVDKYLLYGDYFDVGCFKAGLSKALGYGVIVGSSLVKVPQVVKIQRSRNAAGLSILAILLELLTFTTTFAYSLSKSYPFSSYGEATFLALQTFLIGWMAIALEVSQIAGLAFVVLYGGALAVTLSPVIPTSILYTLQTLNVPVMLSSKFLQIIVNWRNGSTGQLSAVTLLLFALGSTARIFTSIQETGDNLIILTYILSTLCNYALVAQLLYYWKSPIRSTETTGRNSKLKKN